MPDPFYFGFSLQRLKNARMRCRYAHLGVLMISCLKMYAYAYDLSSLFWDSVKNTKIAKIAKQMPKHANKNHEKGTCFFFRSKMLHPKMESAIINTTNATTRAASRCHGYIMKPLQCLYYGKGRLLGLIEAGTGQRCQLSL